MMDDHILLSTVRNDLADALKFLLNPGVMFRDDFVVSRNCVINALNGLNKLISQEDVRKAETLRLRDADIR